MCNSSSIHVSGEKPIFSQYSEVRKSYCPHTVGRLAGVELFSDLPQLCSLSQ